MTVLSAASSAMVRLVGRKPTVLYSAAATDETAVQIADLANEVAADIMKGHDWQALTKIAELTGDGETTSFVIPSDYDRMVLAQDIQSNQAPWLWNYSQAHIGLWIALQNGEVSVASPGWWILLENRFRFNPAPPSGRKAIFPYIAKTYALSLGGERKASFTADNDTFMLDERLLTLGIIWRYREQKGMGYAEDMKTYEDALSQAQARDRGARAIRSRVSSARPGTRVGWPYGLLGE